MHGQDSPELPWPTPKEYGQRFQALNERLGRSLALFEYRGESTEDKAVLQYRLAKLAIAAEDLRRAIGVLEMDNASDQQLAEALTELRGACSEVCDSFVDADDRIIRLMNFLDP